MNSSEIYSVSEFIEIMNGALSGIPAQVVGEISELKVASSGHRYFTLKDKDTGYILPCTIWGRDYQLSGADLEIGMEIAATGKASFYGPFGKLSFNARTVELVGEGALKKAYEKLKKKLSEEGVFDADRKRSVPDFPEKIGIITSLHGAVIHDFSNNLGKFGFKLSVLNSKVEGPESGRDLALSVRAMRSEDIDVLVIIRGGGSIQSLAGFDNEMLVREISTFPVPVLAGVGHHEDVTLAALAADAAESTPSLVATLLNRSWESALRSVDQSEERIVGGYENILMDSLRAVEDHYVSIKGSLDRILLRCQKIHGVADRAVQAMEYRLKEVREKIGSDTRNIVKSFQLFSEKTKLEYCTIMPKKLFLLYQNRLKNTSSYLESSSRLILANSPERQLRFGYSIVYNEGKVVRSLSDIRKGQPLEVQIADGRIITEVLDTKLTK